MGNFVKHPLIILISILLFSSFLTSCEKNSSSPVILDNHEGEILYRWNKYSPFVWKGVGDKETHPIYKGNIENGVPNGHGFIIFPDGNMYVGGWKNGKYNDQGTYTHSDGRKYVGEIKDELFWNGITYDKNGKILYEIVDGK